MLLLVFYPLVNFCPENLYKRNIKRKKKGMFKSVYMKQEYMLLLTK